jgi:putative hydrolase of the HAD superfamily
MVRAFLFDLDDTLFDHKHSRLCGLAALQTRFPQLQPVPIVMLEREHERLLNTDYHLVLDGKISMLDGTALRIKRLCQNYLPDFSEQEAKEAGELYNLAYLQNRQPVVGALEVLAAAKRSATVGVVTNGLVETQKEKLQICSLSGLIDFMITSEEAGFKKPSPEIFQAALQKANATSSETIFVGDSWASDIIPACKLGMQAIWLNRYELTCPNPQLAKEIRSFNEWPATYTQ